MHTSVKRSGPAWFLGIDGGGTRTRVVAQEAAGPGVKRLECGPGNLRLLSDRQLLSHFRAIGARLPWPVSLGIGMAGVRTESDRSRICQAAARIWPGVPCAATNDLEIALLASAGVWGGRPPRPGPTRILVLCGTGSCCFGQRADGTTAKVGGWGHLLGDRGSGYEMGLQALRSVIHHYDRQRQWPALGEQMLRALQLNEPEQLIEWIQSAAKTDIAALSPTVFNAAKRRNKLARGIVERAAHDLAKDGVTCARRLAQFSGPVEFVLAGGVLAGQPWFARKVSALLQAAWPGARVGRLQREGVWGAVGLARREYESSLADRACRRSTRTKPENRAGGADPLPELPGLEQLAESPTEQRNPRSMDLDRMSLEEAIALMLREDARIPAALLKERSKIARGIGLIVRSFRRGGRLFYVGAGTSGRLGVLDASECPPTFQTDPERVQGIMAGGQEALWKSIEGAEDEAASGAAAVVYRGIRKVDVVVGIAASGRTPFVWGALGEAARRGAATIFLHFNPDLHLPKSLRSTVCITPRIGPEILTGSTRLKAGTATKLVLNMFTTLAMVRLGKVKSNLMIDVHPSNAKLRDRAVRIVQSLAGVRAEQARSLLERSRWNIRSALRGLPRA